MSMIKELPISGIKHVPPERAVRERIRRQAVEAAGGLPLDRPPAREALERCGQAVLDQLTLPANYLGFAMVAVNNAFWRAAYETIPYTRRLLLLPHCLSDHAACLGQYDSVGLHCARCGSCAIDGLKAKAEALGYRVIVAEGTSSVIMTILEGKADALLGVACLDSLEKSFTRAVELGIPQVAVPLLKDGCVDTEVELDEVLALLISRREGPVTAPRGYLPLLRESVRIFDEEVLRDLLAGYVEAGAWDAQQADPRVMTDRVALDWLRRGGKRLRPFVTLAAYAAGVGEETVFAGQVPAAVQRTALAIEVLHKASLVHDDIEDNDAYRYGAETLHRTYGIAPAINVGDYLVGLGYRLIAGEAPALGAEAVADILGRLSAAHLELCRGQGAELRWQQASAPVLRPLDVLAIYALKTAPAFELALYAGLRAAGPVADAAALTQYAVYLGEGYQILNDLADWRVDDHNKVQRGLDALAGRPTILRTFALEGSGMAVADLPADPQAGVVQLRQWYTASGAFAKTERLFARLRDRALETAAAMPNPALRTLLEYLVQVVLREEPPAREPRQE